MRCQYSYYIASYVDGAAGLPVVSGGSSGPDPSHCAHSAVYEGEKSVEMGDVFSIQVPAWDASRMHILITLLHINVTEKVSKFSFDLT